MLRKRWAVIQFDGTLNDGGWVGWVGGGMWTFLGAKG